MTFILRQHKALGVVFLALVVLADRRTALTAGVDLPRAALGGLLTLAAYALVLIALTSAPLTVVAPLREAGIVLASGWGALRLREAAPCRL